MPHLFLRVHIFCCQLENNLKIALFRIQIKVLNYIRSGSPPNRLELRERRTPKVTSEM